MSYCKFSEDFINRTKEIISGYRDLFEEEIEKNDGYEITLLLNSMLGLAVFTKDKFFDHLTNEKTFAEKIGEINGVKISGCNPGFKDGVRVLRNTIAHMGDSREDYENEFKINNRDVSLHEDIGEVRTLEFNCKQGNINYQVLVNLEKNKLALDNFLTNLCDAIISS